MNRSRNAGMFLRTTYELIILAVLLCGVVALQYGYDATGQSPSASSPISFTPGMIRMTDMGFHSAVASFLWVGTMPEILGLYSSGNSKYIKDLLFLNGVDPKLSYPYAFSVLVLPYAQEKFPDAVSYSFAIGQAGIRDADPDWRISYYMAINYYLELKDAKGAVHYFMIAAQTPGIPSYAKSFAINFGILRRERDKVRDLWNTVYQSSNDPSVKARAAAYIERFDDLDYLEAAAKTYKQRYGIYPTSTQELVKKNIIPAVPQDPLEFLFTINPDGSAGIDTLKPPPYISNPRQ